MASELEDERDSWRTRLPSGFVLRFAMLAGLFVAWWASFHEIACGCISIRVDVPLLYTYASCYVYSWGCVAGAIAAFFAFRKRPSLPQPRGFAALMAVLVAASAAFYVSLATSSWVAAAAFQFLLSALGVVTVIGLLMAACNLPTSEAAGFLFISLAVYILFNNLVLPAFVYAVQNFYLVAVAQACILVVLAVTMPSFMGEDEARGLLSEGWKRAVEGFHGSGENGARTRIPWQPVFHLLAYSFVFGLMHVESSSLIGGFYNRNLPYAIGALIVAVLFYMTFMRKSSTASIWPKVHEVVFPLSVVSFMLLPDLNTGASYLPVAFVNASYLYYDLLVVLGCWVVAKESGISLVRVFAWAFSVKSLGYFAGTVVCHVQMNALSADVLQTPLASVAVFLLLVAATFWVGDPARVKKLWGMRIELSPKMAHVAELQERCDKLAKQYRLSPKEREIACLLAQGKSTEDITQELFISIFTTRTHIRNMYAKLNVHSRKELEVLVKHGE